MKFYRCRHCGNIIAYVKSSGVKVICCGEEMQELVANTTDGALEKHVPVVEVKGNIVTVKVGSTEHPATEQHHIEWIALQTKFGEQRKEIPVGAKPEVQFALVDGDEVVAAYEYCNLHGLWKSK